LFGPVDDLIKRLFNFGPCLAKCKQYLFNCNWVRNLYNFLVKLLLGGTEQNINQSSDKKKDFYSKPALTEEDSDSEPEPASTEEEEILEEIITRYYNFLQDTAFAAVCRDDTLYSLRTFLEIFIALTLEDQIRMIRVLTVLIRSYGDLTVSLTGTDSRDHVRQLTESEALLRNAIVNLSVLYLETNSTHVDRHEFITQLILYLNQGMEDMRRYRNNADTETRSELPAINSEVVTHILHMLLEVSDYDPAEVRGGPSGHTHTDW
jgi:PAS domain-containing protein